MENQDGGNAPMEVDSQQQEQEQQLPETSEIQRLDNDTIRRITAEQAISDLSSIVKELIDNALDAESTTIKSEYIGQNCRTVFLFFFSRPFPFEIITYWFTQNVLGYCFNSPIRLFVHKFVCLGRVWILSRFPMTETAFPQGLGRIWPLAMQPPRSSAWKIFTKAPVLPWAFGERPFLLWLV